MFRILIQFVFLIYIIFVIFNMLELRRYNINGFIIELADEGEFNLNNGRLVPMVLKNNLSTDFNTLNPFHSHQEGSIKIFKNRDIIKDIDSYNQFPRSILNEKHFLYYKDSITIQRASNSEIIRCVHNYNIISILSGEATIYLINPKHKDDITGKSSKNLKKWAHKKEMKKNETIFIPVNWYYFIETKENVMVHHTDVDNYFTLLPNTLKEYYLNFKQQGK